MASGLRSKVGYNTAKRRALEALAQFPDQWWTVEDWAREAGITPTRRMYTYALRLLPYDLILRGRIRGRLMYRITQNGLNRLAWLRRCEAKLVTLAG
jgi:hypothetical protein